MKDERNIKVSATDIEVPDRQLVHPKVWQFLEYWKSICRNEQELPLRGQFDPIDIPSLLPNVFLFDVIGSPARFRFRLMGETILDSGGPGRPGLWVDEIASTVDGIHLSQVLTKVVDERAPKWYKGPPTLVHHRQVSQLEGIMAPISSDGDLIDTVACLTVDRWLDGRET